MSVAPDDESMARTAALPTPAPVSTRVATDIALVATFAAFVTVCAILPSIPMPGGVPITLQTFGVVLAGLVLGPVRGFLAVALYLAVGFAGLPVFAEGRSGLAVLAGPSVGYLLSFPFAAALAGWFASAARGVRRRWRPAALFAAGFGASLLLVHPLGVAGLMARLDLTFVEAFVGFDLRFWPGDVLKNVAAAAVAVALFRAFPELLRSRR